MQFICIDSILKWFMLYHHRTTRFWLYISIQFSRSIEMNALINGMDLEQTFNSIRSENRLQSPLNITAFLFDEIKAVLNGILLVLDEMVEVDLTNDQFIWHLYMSSAKIKMSFCKFSMGVNGQFKAKQTKQFNSNDRLKAISYEMADFWTLKNR